MTYKFITKNESEKSVRENKEMSPMAKIIKIKPRNGIVLGDFGTGNFLIMPYDESYY